MPLPLLFIGIAAMTGTLGITKTGKAIYNNVRANNVNTSANKKVDEASKNLERQRGMTQESLENLGEVKINILTTQVKEFLEIFEKIKNVDFKESSGLSEIEKLRIDKNDFEQLKKLGNFALHIASGAATGLTGGALTAFGAYSAAQALAVASTGTAISTLSGAAATNATLAFFGGGSLAAGGLGMAGGMMVLGGLVAGPALLVMGLISDSKAQEKVEKAMANKAQADAIVENLNTMAFKASAIRRRANLFYNLLTYLDAQFLPGIWKMEEIIEKEGTDYRKYRLESKEAIAKVASVACSIKAVLDVPVLTDNGELTKESELTVKKLSALTFQN